MDWATEIAEIEQRVASAARTERKFDASPVAIAQTIDHTLLKTDATAEQIDKLCDEAASFGFRTVCVRLPYVSRARLRLGSTAVGVCCVVGFHEGSYSTDDKLKEAKSALVAGAAELDAVLNRAHVAAGTDYAELAGELQALRQAAPGPTKLKLILETARLDRAAIVAATVVAYHAGFDFVKTSTGFDGEGASELNVQLMRQAADALQAKHGRQMEVKASGGVRTFDDAVRMLRAGASRLGASAGVAIVEQARGVSSTTTGTSSLSAY